MYFNYYQIERGDNVFKLINNIDEYKQFILSVRDEFNKDTTAYVGFTFPYTVIE